MPFSTSHGILDGFTAEIWHGIRNKIENEGELWKYPNKDGEMTLLMPGLCGPSGINLHQVKASNNSTLQPDQAILIDWNGHRIKEWPFWIHESCFSETYQHVFDKAKRYVHASNNHVSLISILKMVDYGRPRQQDWHVELSIWRTRRDVRADDMYKPTYDTLLDQVEVYPAVPDPPLKITITKQDLVTFSRNKDETLLDVTMEIDLAHVRRIAQRAVNAKEREALNQPSSDVDPNQLAPSSPLGAGEASEDSYTDEGGSEGTASQRLTTTSSPRNHNSQNDTEEESDHGEAGIDVESEGDTESDHGEAGIDVESEGDTVNDFNGNSAPAIKQRAKDRMAKPEEERLLSISRGEDADGAHTSPKQLHSRT